MKDIFITGIDTNVGKTVISSILVEAFHYDYWKPIQCGDLENSDRKVVLSMVQNQISRIHEEAYVFSKAASPHLAAKPNKIDIKNIKRPVNQRPLIIEGAGGLLVPLNERYYMVDLIKKLNCNTVIVSRNYVGSINHTLATVEVLQKRGLPILGIIFNGVHDSEIEDSILERSGLPKLLHVFSEKAIDKDVIKKYALKLNGSNEFRPKYS